MTSGSGQVERGGSDPVTGFADRNTRDLTLLRWSSYRPTIGLEPPGSLAVDPLLAYFADSREAARERYRIHVEERVGDGLAATLDRSVIFGSEEFARSRTGGIRPNGEVARRYWQPVRPSLEELLASPTNATIADAYSRYGYTMCEIAAPLLSIATDLRCPGSIDVIREHAPECREACRRPQPAVNLQRN